MKTYSLFYILLVCLIFIGCNKSDEGLESDIPKESSVISDYILLLSTDEMLSAQPLNASLEALSINLEESQFVAVVLPQLTYREGSVLSLYHKVTNCTAEVTKYDFDDNTTKAFEVFTDLGNCNLTATSIVHSETVIYIAYTLEVTAKGDKFFVRIFDTSTSEPTFKDVELEKKPIQLTLTDSRLFILTFDEEITDENSLTVMDITTSTLIHEMNLGYDARQLIKNIDENIIISYDELHTVLNSTTMNVEYTSYEAGKEPKFADSKVNHIDSTGKLYYERESEGEIPHIPVIYDFSKNIVYLYMYENFLTEAQIKFEFEISDTTVVGYDEVNNLILIGYKKSGEANKGGLLRVKPVPDPAFVDNIDLDGVPYDIFVK
ncbi:MAG: hypothetical protein QM485_05385 [Flavobacteriaceae bacterium]